MGIQLDNLLYFYLCLAPLASSRIGGVVLVEVRKLVAEAERADVLPRPGAVRQNRSASASPEHTSPTK